MCCNPPLGNPCMHYYAKKKPRLTIGTIWTLASTTMDLENKHVIVLSNKSIKMADVCTWKMVECLESVGKILMPCFLAKGST